jgi:uncharacterized protein YktB (UPF0637 family)
MENNTMQKTSHDCFDWLFQQLGECKQAQLFCARACAPQKQSGAKERAKQIITMIKSSFEGNKNVG